MECDKIGLIAYFKTNGSKYLVCWNSPVVEATYTYIYYTRTHARTHTHTTHIHYTRTHYTYIQKIELLEYGYCCLANCCKC